MKKKFYIIIFTLSIIFGGTLGTVGAKTYYAYCSAYVGQTHTCSNMADFSNDLASFRHTMQDQFNPTSAYNIKHNKVILKPYSVNRGAPLIKTYTLSDNKNSKHYTYSQHSGKYLNDYSSITITTGKNTGYYPASYQRPTTSLQLRSGDGWDCYSKPTACITITQASQLSVR